MMCQGEGERLRLEGNAAYSSGAFEEAEARYSESLAYSDAPETLRGTILANRSQVRLKLGNNKGALEDAVAALSINPRNVKASYRQIAALIGLGDANNATRICEKTLQSTTDPFAKRQLKDLLLEAKARLQHAAVSIPQRPETQDANPNWKVLREQTPPREWFPPLLRQGWEWIPNLSPDRGSENLLLIFHGMGDSPANFGKLARTMGLPGTACLALAAPLQLPLNSGRTWFKSVDDDWLELPVQQVASSLKSTVQLLQAFIGNLHMHGGWPLSRIHLLGYSQGGTLALHLANHYRGEEALGSCVSISGAALGGCLESDGVGTTTPVLITHGDKDTEVPRADIERTLSSLRKTGGNARLHSVPGKGHGMIGNEHEMRAIMAFWAKYLKAGAPKSADGADFVEVQNKS